MPLHKSCNEFWYGSIRVQKALEESYNIYKIAVRSKIMAKLALIGHLYHKSEYLFYVMRIIAHGS